MGSRLLNFDEGTGICVESQLERLSLESAVLSNVLDAFSNVIPSLYEKLKVAYISIIPETDLLVEFKSSKKALSELKVKFQHAKYLDYDKTLVSVPEGFKGNLLQYIHTLLSIAPSVFQGANETLAEYNFVLSSFITNKENKTALKDHTDLYKKIKKQREYLNDQMSKYFTSSSSLSKAYLGDVITRFSEVDPLLASAEKLKMMQKSQNLKEVADSVKRSVDLLNIIIDDTRNKGIAQVSGNAAVNVAQGAYELGKYVEFLAIYRYRVEQAIVSACRLAEDINRII